MKNEDLERELRRIDKQGRVVDWAPTMTICSLLLSVIALAVAITTLFIKGMLQ